MSVISVISSFRKMDDLGLPILTILTPFVSCPERTCPFDQALGCPGPPSDPSRERRSVRRSREESGRFEGGLDLRGRLGVLF